MNTEPLNLEPGDGVTICRQFDRITATVVRVNARRRVIWIQDDSASLDPPDWKPVFEAGGLRGHCVNQLEQRYHYHRDLFGRVRRASLGKDGVWRTTMGERVVTGRSKFHDYNL